LIGLRQSSSTKRDASERSCRTTLSLSTRCCCTVCSSSTLVSLSDGIALLYFRCRPECLVPCPQQEQGGTPISRRAIAEACRRAGKDHDWWRGSAGKPIRGSAFQLTHKQSRVENQIKTPKRGAVCCETKIVLFVC
jgi:hypothetical protein